MAHTARWRASATATMAKQTATKLWAAHQRCGLSGGRVGVRGQTADCETLLAQVQCVRHDFEIRAVVMVGDRGMIAQSAIDKLRALDAVRSHTMGPLSSETSLIVSFQLENTRMLMVLRPRILTYC